MLGGTILWEDKIEQAFVEEVITAVKTLIEEKHLYQSVSLSPERLRAVVEKPLVEMLRAAVDLPGLHYKPTAEQIVGDLLKASWVTVNPASPRQGGYLIEHNNDPVDHLKFHIKNIRTHCGSCDENSPMNLVAATDAIARLSDWVDVTIPNDHSVYTFVFQCQSCRVGIEVFIVARRGRKFTLVGRSPMEQVKVPYFIPKDVHKYYSGAVIAFNSGQILPALFMLRTLVEQYLRGEMTTVSSEKIDKVIDAYMDSLPNDFTDRFPSLKDVYGKLSNAVHCANESADLFHESREKIERHFDARRVFEM